MNEKEKVWQELQDVQKEMENKEEELKSLRNIEEE